MAYLRCSRRWLHGFSSVASQLFLVITDDALCYIYWRSCCCAIVAGEAIFAMMRIFESLADQYFRAIRVFRVAAEAERWRTLQRLSVP